MAILFQRTGIINRIASILKPESIIAKVLPAAILSDWADYLPPADVARRLESMSTSEQQEVLEGLSDDEFVDFLQEVEEEDHAKFIEMSGCFLPEADLPRCLRWIARWLESPRI